LGDVDADIVEYQLGDSSRASGRRLSQMALPDGTVVAMITRGNEVIPPRGSTFLHAGDHLFIVMKPDVREFVDLVCSGVAEASHHELPTGELRLKGYTKVEDVQHSYGIELFADGALSLDEVLRQALATEPSLDASKTFGAVTLYVRDMVGQRIATVGIVPTAVSN
jgi:cell volume regulation protein A